MIDIIICDDTESSDNDNVNYAPKCENMINDTQIDKNKDENENNTDDGQSSATMTINSSQICENTKIIDFKHLKHRYSSPANIVTNVNNQNITKNKFTNENNLKNLK